MVQSINHNHVPVYWEIAPFPGDWLLLLWQPQEPKQGQGEKILSGLHLKVWFQNLLQNVDEYLIGNGSNECGPVFSIKKNILQYL